MCKKRKVIIIISWLAVILWMGVIFSLSAQPRNQSNGLSKGVTEVVIETVKRVTPEADFDIDSLNHIIRKNAHFFVYLVLGLLVMNAVVKQLRIENGELRIKKFKDYSSKRLALALGICVLYAISDEVHQLFVPGRGPQVKDVFIDSAGACVGIMIYLGFIIISKKVMTRREVTC